MGLFSSIGSAISDITGAITPGVGSLLGAAVSGGASLLGGLNQQASAEASVQQQEQFQEQERLSSYPDTVKSLEDAGLNPMLAVTNGPLGTPSGAMYNPQNILGGAVTSAQQGYQMQAQLDNTNQNTATSKAQEDKTANDALVSGYNATKQGMTIKNLVNTTNAQAAADKAEADVKLRLFRDHPDMMMSGEMLQNFFGPLANTAKTAAPLLMAP